MTDEVYVSANDAIGFNVYDRSTLNGSGQLMLNYDVWGDDGNDKGEYKHIWECNYTCCLSSQWNRQFVIFEIRTFKHNRMHTCL